MQNRLYVDHPNRHQKLSCKGRAGWRTQNQKRRKKLSELEDEWNADGAARATAPRFPIARHQLVGGLTAVII